jgi:hypothetical protein
MVAVGSPAAQTLAAGQAPVRSGAGPMAAGYFNVNGAYLAREHSSIQHLSVPAYDETAVLEASHAGSPDVGLDAALGVRVWSGFSVGLGVTHFRTANDVEVTGTFPHPLVRGRVREVRHRPEGFDRTDIGMHLHAAWTIRLSDRLDLALSAGPSIFQVKQDSVSVIAQGEVAPYDVEQIEFRSASTSTWLLGANVGADLTCHLVRSLEPGALFWTVGVGVFVQWARGTSALDGSGPDGLEAGGLRAGAGLRFRF